MSSIATPELMDEVRLSIEDLREHLLQDQQKLSPDSALPHSEFKHDQQQVSREIGRKGRWDAAAVFDLQQMAGLGVFGVSSLLLSVSRLIYLPVSIRSIQILARTGIEIGARNHWLLDPTVTTRTRIMRAVAEALHSTQEDARASAKFENDQGKRRAEQFVEAAVQWADNLDLPLSENKAGRRSLHDCRRPNSSDLIEHFVSSVGGQYGSALYGYLSAATHGQPFHLVKLGGDALEIQDTLSKDLRLQLTLVVQVMKVTHVRYAQYLGLNPRPRLRPYETTLETLQRVLNDTDVVGQL